MSLILISIITIIVYLTSSKAQRKYKSLKPRFDALVQDKYSELTNIEVY